MSNEENLTEYEIRQQFFLDATNWFFMAAQAVVELEYRQTRNDREMTGKDWIMHHLGGHPLLCYDNYRLSTEHFNILCDELLGKGLECNGNVIVEEQVAMFLETLGHGIVMRKIGDEFQHSTETVHKCFHNVLDAILKMKHDYIKTPTRSDHPVHPKVAPGTRLEAFKGALGAIDGTHIKAFPDSGEKYPERFRCRKSFLSQNVMMAVDFDGNILAVVAGWEGSSHDQAILRKAVQNGFPVPTGRYYLVDGGYSSTSQFVAPYRKVNSHIAQFNRSNRGGRNRGGRNRGGRIGRRTYASPEEYFNHKQAQLRNEVEKTFGILKSRFRILVDMHKYKFKTQVDIVVACCVIHNFINHHSRLQDNPEDARFEQQLRSNIAGSSSEGNVEETSVQNNTQAGSELRDSIRDLLWANRRN